MLTCRQPLAISMAILQTIAVIRSIIKAAKSVYSAPEELESLLNDLMEGENMVLWHGDAECAIHFLENGADAYYIYSDGCNQLRSSFIPPESSRAIERCRSSYQRQKGIRVLQCF